MATKKWYQFIIDFLESIFKPKPEQKPTESYIVAQGQRIEKIARSVSFNITPARDGSASLEDVPVWAYAGTNPDTWNGGNNTGLLSVRVKANNTTSYELKVGPTPSGVKEPDVQAPCKTGVKVAMKLELLANGVKFTAGGDSKFVECDVPTGNCTIGIGWPPQKRQGCLGAAVDDVVWG